MPEKLLWNDFGLKAFVATEIEFYLTGDYAKFSPSQIIELISQYCTHGQLDIAAIDQERGPGQYEISLLPTSDIQKIIANTEHFKRLIAEAFARHSIGVNFSAKPFAEHPGSGLHVHVHLENATGKNVFFREEEDFSPQLLDALGGLLALMNPCMVYFAPTEASYARFHGSHNAPQTVSWGTNNRTVALRLPTKPMANKHIEHRVAGSDADVGKAVRAILAGVHYGLKHALPASEPTYGNAGLAQYNLPKLAQTLKQSELYNADSKELSFYLNCINRDTQ